MKLLAIETASDACSVAIMHDSQILFDHRVATQQHAAILLPMIDALMDRAGMSAAQLDALIYGRGPGSFTGVRIGVAAAQGIALGADLGVAGVSSLQAIAQGCFRRYSDTSVAISIDARMDEIYFCQYQLSKNELMLPVSDEVVIAPDAISHDLFPRFAGSGADRYQHILESRYSISDEQIRYGCLPDAQDLLNIGASLVSAGELQAAEEAMPVYLRNKVALTTQERVMQRNSRPA